MVRMQSYWWLGCLAVAGILWTVALPATAQVQSATYEKEVKEWLDSAVKYGNFAGAETAGHPFEPLMNIGPNVLPELVAALRIASTVPSSTSVHAQYALKQAIGMIAGIKTYGKPDARLVKPDDENPAILRDASAALALVLPDAPLPGNADGLDRSCKMILTWWDARTTDATKRALRDYIGELTRRKSSDQAFTKKTLLKRSLGREGIVVWTHGIYGLPELVHASCDTDNPEAFCLFLLSSKSADYGRYYKSEGALWPTGMEKANYIRAWWTRERPRYARLTDLVEEIDKAVSDLPKE